MDLEKLKTLAQDVKQWSNCNSAWLDHSNDEPAAVIGHISEDGETYPVAVIDCDQYYEAQDSIKLARFYAAANPEMVLRLIAMIESPNAELTGGADPANVSILAPRRRGALC